MTIHLVPLLALAVVLAACDPRLRPDSNLSPREIQALSGTLEGRSSLSSGEKDCPPYYLWTLRVGGGNVDGEIVNAETPRAPVTKFSTFLDYDGTLRALARPGGTDTTIQGTFHRDSFSGESKTARCAYNVRLRRTAGS